MKNKNSETPKIKKVKIDDHIRGVKGGNNSPPVRKRGRPRKNSESLHLGGENHAGGDALPGVPGMPEGAADSDHSESPAASPAVVAVYDTTEEAKAFLRAPFDMAAGLTGVSRLALYPTQLEALAPSFKVVYDKRILPKLGEDADLIAFTVALSGVIFEKVQVYREARPKAEARENHSGQVDPPSIRTEFINQ